MSDNNAKVSSHRETHGRRVDINDDTPINDVKAPNVFERVKEEFEAIFETIHSPTQAKGHVTPFNETEKRDETKISELKSEKPTSALQEKDVVTHNEFGCAKGGTEAIIHKPTAPHHHHRETHGRSDDIDENTPISDVKGPSVFERAKEEVEALVDAFRHKDETKKTEHSPKKETGCFGVSLGKGLEKVCSPFGHKKD